MSGCGAPSEPQTAESEAAAPAETAAPEPAASETITTETHVFEEIADGVYFVTGNPPVDGHPFSGKLELVDPRPGASLSYSERTRLYGRFLVNPQPGQLVVFPGWLQHQVHPYFGPAERISIAFNATHGQTVS